MPALNTAWKADKGNFPGAHLFSWQGVNLVLQMGRSVNQTSRSLKDQLKCFTVVTFSLMWTPAEIHWSTEPTVQPRGMGSISFEGTLVYQSVWELMSCCSGSCSTDLIPCHACHRLEHKPASYCAALTMRHSCYYHSQHRRWLQQQHTQHKKHWSWVWKTEL